MDRIKWKWLKTYNNYSSSDRNAIIILGTLILLSVIANIIVQNLNPASKYNYSEYRQFIKDLENPNRKNGDGVKNLFVFNPNTISKERLDSLDIPGFVKQNMLNYRKAGGKFMTLEHVRKIYGMNDSIYSVIKEYIVISEDIKPLTNGIPEKTKTLTGFFDPNKAALEELTLFGFNQFQARNVVEYRKKGGVFKSGEDLMRIYGIDSVFYKTIQNHIQLDIAFKDVPAGSKPVRTFFTVELNKADSAEMLKLNGVGPVFANRILKYRDRLGGFHTTGQLLEVYNFPLETYRNIMPGITVDTLLIKKIRLNFAEFPELIRHPYLSKQQVEAILKYRQRNGAFNEIVQIKTNGLVDSETFSRIQPYLTCR